MLARARALARPASLRHCSVSRAAPAATIWSEPPKPPSGTLEKLADAVRLVALKGACAAPLVSLASMASASSGGGAEAIGDCSAFCHAGEVLPFCSVNPAVRLPAELPLGW